MQQPTRLISTPFAQEGEKTEIQNVTGEFDNSATYRLGFPPLTMQSIQLGGKPPKGTDFNGVLFDITENISFLCKGGRYQYNAGLSTLIGGYPEGSNLLLDDNVTEVVSTVAGNQNNPNADMTGWTFKPNRTTAEYVADASGETQQQVNYNGGSKWHSRVGGYQENERVVLTNGDIVKSAINGNTNDPNVDMTGWVPDNAKNYTDGVIFSGLTENIYETNIEVTPSTGTVLAGTVVYAEPARYDGVISKAHGYLRAGVAQFKAKIFQRVGNDFLLVASSNIPIVLGSSEHILDTPLSIKRGQYVGFFTVGAGVEFILKPNSRPYKYESGDAYKIAVGTLATNAAFLMYFESKSLSLYDVVQNNVANTIKNSTMLEALSDQLITANDFIGAETLTGGIDKAGVEYVAYTKTVENAGFVDSVDFNLLADDSVAFFSLRMQSDNSYRIINETPYIAYTSGINTEVLEDFYVKEGDILGWKTLAKNLAWDISAQNVTPYCVPTRTSANVMTVSTSFAFAQSRIKFNTSYAPKALQVVVLTQAQYDALPSKDPNVLYGVV